MDKWSVLAIAFGATFVFDYLESGLETGQLRPMTNGDMLGIGLVAYGLIRGW